MHPVESQWIKKLLYFCVKGLFCVLENNFLEIFYWSWWEKLNNYISYLLWQIIILFWSVDVKRGLLHFFPLLLIFWGLINNQNILQLGLIELSKYDLKKKGHCLR
jgi:hypothetical protein